MDFVPHRLLKQAETRGGAPAYAVFRDGQWHKVNWSDYAAQIRRAARALIALGVKPEGRVCIMGFNRPEWTIMDHAAMMAGAVPVGVYSTSSAEEIEHIVHHSGASVVLLESDDHFARLKTVAGKLPDLKHVVMMEGASVADKLQTGWEDFLKNGDDKSHDAEIDKRLSTLTDDTLGTLIYTSGTTGRAKAVMLSHGGLAWTGRSAVGLFGFEKDDRVISYLPLAHIVEQLQSLHMHATSGYTLYFARSLEKLAEELKSVQPNFFFGVPRVWEKMHETIAGRLAEATGVKKRIAAWAMGVGRRYHDARLEGDGPGAGLTLQHRIAGRLVYSKLKDAVGFSHARGLLSGAAPLSQSVIEFFASLDLIVNEGYGQTENFGYASIGTAANTRFGSVGKPPDGIDIAIAEDGEILTRGPQTFLGYLHDDKATAETLIDGWLHSGDLGHRDKDGFVFVTGRKKDIIITSGGKNITPALIEAALMEIDLVEHAILIGDRRKFLSVVLTLSPQKAEAFCKERGMAMKDAYGSDEIRKEIQDGIDRVNKRFARVENVRRFTIVPRSLTMDNGELTPTLKIRRNQVAENFNREIDAMYGE